jgi:GAG-pre-integrase domain
MAVFDPFSVHELTSPSTTIDCVTRSVAEGLLFDDHQELNGPTAVLHQGLTSEAFRLLAADPQALMSVGGSSRKPVIFDTGASLGITYDKDDFDGPLTVPEGDLRLGGMAQGLKIAGVGPVTWTFRNPDGSEVRIRSQCYYVPEAKVRLISPQRLYNKSKGVTGKFEGDEDTFTLIFDGGHRLVVEYDPCNHLPIGYATVGDDVPPLIDPQANLTLFDDTNQNITAGHRLLMNWHGRFGHLNFLAVQRILRHFPFVSVKFAAASRCDLTDFRCEICQYAKAHHRTTHGKKTQLNEERD